MSTGNKQDMVYFATGCRSETRAVIGPGCLFKSALEIGNGLIAAWVDSVKACSSLRQNRTELN